MSWLNEYKKSLKMIEIEEYFDLFFYRPLAFCLIKIIYRTNIIPNQLTLTAICFGFAAGCVYATGNVNFYIYAALLYMLYNIVDCSDGQLARLKKNGTHAGRIIDGIADYLAAAAVFIGLGIGYPDHQYSRGIWWLMIAAIAVSNIIQSILVDYYRNRFLDYVLQRKSTFEEDLESFKDEYKALQDQKGKWFDKCVIRVYFEYTALQNNLTTKKKDEKLFKASPKEYYAENKRAMRWWVFIGPTSQITAIMICTAFNRFDILLWIEVGLFNLIGSIMWLIQKRIDKKMKAMSHQQ